MKQFVLFLLGVFVSTASIAQVKVAFVDTEKVLDTMVFRANKLRDVQQLQMIAQKDFIARDSSNQVAQRGIKPEWSQGVKDYEMRRIQRSQEQLEYDMQQMEQQLQQQSYVLSEEINTRVKTAIATVSKLKGLSYVIDKAQLLYISNGIDITTDVVNEIIASEKKEGIRK